MVMIKEALTYKGIKNTFKDAVKAGKESSKEYKGMMQSASDKKYVKDIQRKLKGIFNKFKDTDQFEDLASALTNEVSNEIEIDNSEWTYVASALHSYVVHGLFKVNVEKLVEGKEASEISPYEWLIHMVDKRLLTEELIEKYSEEEINEAYSNVNDEKDLLFTGIGYHTMVERYCIRGYNKELLETPQMRWVTIALINHQNEKPEKRMELVKESYWALSNLYMTVATPTLANSGKPGMQLSSCFIDTVDDSLDGIYQSNSDAATLSKFGGGIGVYMGKVRSRGSNIRGFKGASSGIVPWIRQLNNTAVSVDQLGQRQGAIAVYLDVWHKDIIPFLELKLNNGDERLRAHDIFTAASIPDIFMRQLNEVDEDGRSIGDWYLFDPHEVKQVMGFSLEDSYDEEFGGGTFTKRYMACVENPELSKKKVKAMDIMKPILRSQMESGTPFMFYRDEVNRANPNKHEGMIYSSNLCTEITQNMSSTQKVISRIMKSDELNILGLPDGEDIIVEIKKPGEMVVCNLSSINLGRSSSNEILERLIPIQVRMLDNVIDINKLPLPQAQLNNSRYRAVGLGTFGWHHHLALSQIDWESEEAVKEADRIYEKIAYETIKASMELSKEKGAYPLFKGSDWDTGEYFTQRGYFETVESIKENSSKAKWKMLHEDIQKYGLRNGYLMAVAPNSSTSIIAGSTASIDPVFQPFFYEEKKNYRLPNIAPNLSPTTYSFYKGSYVVDQRWSVKQNAARQRHIDQAISFNMYVPNNIKASVLLDLHKQAWESRIKTTYYTRSTAMNIEECEWCHS